MNTQCPACKTVFRLRLDQLNAARGQVRCSRCHTVFNALDNLFHSASDVDQPAELTKQPFSEASEALVEQAKQILSTPEEQATPDAATDVEPAQITAVTEDSQTSEEQKTDTAETLAETLNRDVPLPPPRKAQSRPGNGTRKKVVSRAEDMSTALASSPSTRPSEIAKDSPKAPSQDKGPSAVEETLPLFGSEEHLPDTETRHDIPAEQPDVSSAKASVEHVPPLFEFNSIIEEPLFDTEPEPGAPAKDKESRGKKSPPAAPEPQERDLFDLNEATEQVQDDALLFHYLPEAEQAEELIVNEAQVEESQASPRGEAKKQKTKTVGPGYSLPLERESSRGNLRGAFFWSIGIASMLAGLALQYIYYHRMPLAGEPHLRPLLAQMCQFTGCQLPPQRDLGRIELSKHLVQVHPRYENSLLITAILINRADFVQPFPIVEVVMTDLEQKQVARRRFRPREYLIGDAERLLPPATEVPLMLEVLDPGHNAVGFEFNFY